MRFWFFIATVIIHLAAYPSTSVAAENEEVEQKGRQHRITILSIIPAQGEPETAVTLSGSGFTPGTTVFLGNNATKTEVINSKLLTFSIPSLAPGLYAMFLKDAEGTTSRTYNFSLLPPKPVIYSLSPDTIQACSSDRERHVSINGHNFRESSQVVFDGAAIRGAYISRESFSFTVPRVAPGLHQVQIKNPGETFSGAQGLLIDSRPEIDSVSSAEEYVTYYNLVLTGRNFQQDSAVVVTEEREAEQSGNLSSDEDIKRLRSGTTNPLARDRIIFVNCGKIIYQRFPYSTAPKSFKVQVVNPGGEESSIVQVSAP